MHKGKIWFDSQQKTVLRVTMSVLLHISDNVTYVHVYSSRVAYPGTCPQWRQEAGLNTSVFVDLRLFLFDYTCQLSFSIPCVCPHTCGTLCTPTPTDTPHTCPAHPCLGPGQREDRAAVWVLLKVTWARLRVVCTPESALAEARRGGGGGGLGIALCGPG